MSSGHGKRREVHEEHEEHANHERWLVSYADMVTLLMVLFIVMFAISQVDQKKFAALATGLSSGFGAPVSMMAGADSMLEVGGAIAPDFVDFAGAGAPTTTAVEPDQVARLAKAMEKAQVAKEVGQLRETKEELEAALRKAGLPKGASFTFDERGLVVTIATDKVLFVSGGADLRPEGERILGTLAPTLRKLPNRLSIDGHTNHVPISTAQFPSNWELSSDRATGVLRHLAAEHRLSPSKMAATGFADTRPRVKRSDPRALSVNRRVEIVVLARVDNAAGRAVQELGNAASPTTSKAPTTPATTSRSGESDH